MNAPAEKTEVWKPILGYEGLYEVSDLGRIRSLPRQFMRGGRRVNWPGRLRKLHVGPGGYLTISLNNGTSQIHRVHVVATEAFHGPRPAGMIVRHLDGNQTNNKATNLTWGTPTQNNQDKVLHGTDHYARRNRCSRDHLYMGPNVQIAKHDGGTFRRCVSCQHAYAVKYKAKARGRASIDVEAVADAHYVLLMEGIDPLIDDFRPQARRGLSYAVR